MPNPRRTPTRYKWYALVFFLVAIVTAALFVADFRNHSPARTTVPIAPNSPVQPAPDNDKPAAEEGGPYR